MHVLNEGQFAAVLTLMGVVFVALYNGRQTRATTKTTGDLTERQMLLNRIMGMETRQDAKDKTSDERELALMTKLQEERDRGDKYKALWEESEMHVRQLEWEMFTSKGRAVVEVSGDNTKVEVTNTVQISPEQA